MRSHKIQVVGSEKAAFLAAQVLSSATNALINQFVKCKEAFASDCNRDREIIETARKGFHD